MDLVIATQNKGKIKEIKEILKDLPVHVFMAKELGFHGEIEETKETFAENALLKASCVSSALKRYSLADDSGLEVMALNRAPGVYSARFAGLEATDEENNRKLLQLLKGVPMEERKASFRCVLALSFPSGGKVFFQGSCDGYIACSPKGEYGFGYDPLFLIERYGKTFAQLGPEVKNRISHRAKALQKFKEYMNTCFPFSGRKEGASIH